MPLFANSIDDFDFEDMFGVLHPKAEQLEVIVRPGRNGEALRKTGVRAVPSQIVTLHYVVGWAGAKNAIDAYIALIDGDPYEVIQRDESYGYFRVLSVVQLPQTRYSVNNVGALLSNTTVRQYCAWTLISTEAPP
jgi:hypothetical protein